MEGGKSKEKKNKARSTPSSHRGRRIGWLSPLQ